MTSALGALLALACTAAGVALLRAAWSRRGGAARLIGGWAALAASALGWRLAGAEWDKAVALAALTPSLAALAVVALGADARASGRSRAPRAVAELEPPPRSSPRGRAWVRVAGVGPLAFAAATACAAAVALKLPADPADRLVAGGFLLPIAWAAGAVWATTDDRPGRTAAALAALALAGFGAAAL